MTFQSASSPLAVLIRALPKPRCLLAVALLLGQALVISAQRAAPDRVWERLVESGKGAFTDQPAPHPLEYFTRDPFLRDDGDDLCGDCTPAGKLTVHLQHRFETKLQTIGECRGLTTYNLFYIFDDHIESGTPNWKSILVKVSPGQFREIYHLQPTQAELGPPFFMTAGGTRLLATRDPIPGTGHMFYEAYWWFGPRGPIRIDIDSVSGVLHSFLPPGFGVWKGGVLDMGNLTLKSAVWRDGDGNCCPTGGNVQIRFRLHNGNFVVVSKRYDAEHSRPQ